MKKTVRNYKQVAAQCAGVWGCGMWGGGVGCGVWGMGWLCSVERTQLLRKMSPVFGGRGHDPKGEGSGTMPKDSTISHLSDSEIPSHVPSVAGIVT